MNRVRATIGSVALLLATTVAGTAHADPTGPPPGPPPGPVAPPPADPVAPAAADPAADPVLPPVPGSGDPIRDACKQFALAANLGASNYEDFAYASAGNGDYVNYQDPNVDRTSLVARAALRAAAGAATDAANTPGVPPEVADPMRNWSLHATKLIFIIAIHGGGNSLNDAVQQLNVDYNSAQKACAVGLAHSG